MDLIYRYDPYQPISVTSAKDAESAIKVLCDGNRRLSSLVTQMQRVTLGESQHDELVIPFCPISLGVPLWSGAIITQRPYAMVLGCSDARVPIEVIFDQSFNDLFVIRIAGNVLGTECLGSVAFAVRQFVESLKLVVVLGHTGCGAVSAAVETYLSPQDYADISFTHALRSLVDRIMIAVRGAAHALRNVCGSSISQHPNYKEALKELAAYLNAAITALDLRREMRSFSAEEMKVVYAVYDLGTMCVCQSPQATPTDPGFATAPQQDDLAALAERLAKAVVAKGLLDERIDV